MSQAMKTKRIIESVEKTKSVRNVKKPPEPKSKKRRPGTAVENKSDITEREMKETSMEKALHAGFDEYVTKPNLVRQILSRTQP